MSSIGFITRYARRYVKPLSIAILSTIFLVGVQLLAPYIVKLLIANVKGAAAGTASIRFITFLTAALLAIYVARGFFRFLSSYMSHVAGWGVVADARKDIYDHLQRQSMGFYEDRKTGELMSRVVNDTDKFEFLVSHAIPDTLVNILTLIGVSAVMLSMNAKLMLLTLIPIPLVLLTVKGFSRYVRPAFHHRQEELAELNARIHDNLSGMREIQAFNREEIESHHVGERIRSYRLSLLRALKLMATFSPFIEFSSSLGTIIVIYFGGRLAFNQILPIEDLVAFFLYLEMFYQPVRILTTAWENTQEAVVGAERVADLMTKDPDVRNRKDARPLPERIDGKIEFRDVCFRYGKGETVLEHIDLTIPPKKNIALVGPTGVGKTTLASLIPRFYDVIDGSIRIDGTDVRDVTLDSLRSGISIVLQDVFLFNGTVRENLLFGNPGAGEERIVEAAKIANAHEFISKMPEGYDTTIGERGVKLSGGQKQRLSIARAVLKDAPILILDEATSSVDPHTEWLIKEALDRLMEGRTTIIIAHRLSTIRNADLIAVLEDRTVKELGTHDELMQKRGIYHRLSSVQALTL